MGNTFYKTTREGAFALKKIDPDHIHPFRQGNLDGLCGIYGIINSIRWGLRHEKALTKRQSRRLYVRLIQHLEDQELLAAALETGLCIPEISQLLHAAKEWLAESDILLKHQKPFHRQKAIKSSTFVDCIAEAVETPNTSVLMATVGRPDHWTSVIGVDKDRLTLFDSSGFKRIGIQTGDMLPILETGKSFQFLSTGLFILRLSLKTTSPAG
jgi:hypothetical protein